METSVKRDIAVTVRGMFKVYKLYDRPTDRLREAFDIFRRRYHRDFYALRDIDFVITRGECVGILGKNGSGKSTLLKTIAGIITPTRGTVRIAGRVGALLDIGSCFNPEMSGLENIYFNGLLMGYGKSDVDRMLSAIVSFADIGEFLYQPVKMYSVGMFVRLAFSVAINVDPDILVIDEALAVGDIGFQAKCYHKIDEFRRKKKTILFVTHALDDVLRYCDRALVLNGGAVVCDTDPHTAVDTYKRIIAGCLLYDPVPAAAGSEKFPVNKSALCYGNHKAEIVGFGIFDKEGTPSVKLFNNDKFVITMTVRFNAQAANPIFSYTIKDLKGTEISGTNTLFKHVETGSYEQGDCITVSFTQVLNLKEGSYTLSLGCSNFEGGEHVVCHRLYDIVLFEAISSSRTVGFFDLKSEIALQRAPRGGHVLV
ncbi:MAG: ABC transporter ATP-binding protein [Candidatus Omnitrophica bacterium]|nr:ABC transporter ATP-binding protein [Candidatus Omnitrophota bacterium]